MLLSKEADLNFLSVIAFMDKDYVCRDARLPGRTQPNHRIAGEMQVDLVTSWLWGQTCRADLSSKGQGFGQDRLGLPGVKKAFCPQAACLSSGHFSSAPDCISSARILCNGLLSSVSPDFDGNHLNKHHHRKSCPGTGLNGWEKIPCF